jgi:hypothetical protein
MTSSTTRDNQISTNEDVESGLSTMASYSRLTPEDRLNIIVDLILDAIEKEEDANNVDAT